MKNSIYILANAFRYSSNNINYNRKKYKPQLITLFTILSVFIIFLILLYKLIKSKNAVDEYVIISTIMILIVLLLAQILFDIRKFNSSNYIQNKNMYDIKIKKFKLILENEFKINSKNKILHIIEECDKEIERLEKNNTDLLDICISVLSKIVIPVMIFGFGLIVKGDSFIKGLEIEQIIYATILSVILLLLIIIAVVIFSYAIQLTKNDNLKMITQLRSGLKDIYIQNFAEIQ